MNKRFSTLLAAALVAGSSFSVYAQLDGRSIEWGKQVSGRAYYLAGVHSDTKQELQAFTLNGYVNDENVTAANSAENAQWTVETKTENGVSYYAFKNISGEQYLAFKKDNGVYVVADKKEANDATKTLRWFSLGTDNKLQAAISGETLYLGLKLATDGVNWEPTLTSGGNNLVVKDCCTLYEIYNKQVSAKDFANKFGDNFTLEFPETLEDTDVFENVSVKEVEGDALGFKLVDDKGTKDEDDDEYIVLTSERVKNSELANPENGYYYKRMTGAEFKKAVDDEKINGKNIIFYAEESATNIGKGAYAIVQKGVKVSDDATNVNVTFGKVTNDETVRQLASVAYDSHSKFMAVTVGKGTRVAATEVANERMLIVNVTATVKDSKKTYAFGMNEACSAVQLYDKVSSAEFAHPQGQWLVSGNKNNNTIELINVHNPAQKVTGVALYEAEGENTYKVMISGYPTVETITLAKVADYDKDAANGYYNTLSAKGQKFAFVTNGTFDNEGDEAVDLFMKIGASERKDVSVVPHAGSEWELIRSEEATVVETGAYSFYNGEKWVVVKGENGKKADGADYPADTLRQAYSYSIQAGELKLGSGWNTQLVATDKTTFLLKEKGKGTYAIVYAPSTTAIAGYTKIDDNKVVNGGTGESIALFDIIDLDAAPSLEPDSKHMTFEAVDRANFITADANNAAVLATEAAALWIDSVNVEGFATPKFFISYAGKMMVTGERLAEIAEQAYEYDKIDKKEKDAIVASTKYSNGVNRIMFMDAARVAGEDTLMIGDQKVAGKAIDAFKFTITENEDGDYVLKNVEDGSYVYVINGNLVYGKSAKEAEAFVIEVTSTPTANEGIATSEVKVLAGNGNVTIAGAAGKKVVVSNILGQVVANTVVSSDNAVIAAPAGVVVVTVEGEAAVKAIVK